MKDRIAETTQDDDIPPSTVSTEFNLQCNRIRKILDEAIFKLEILRFLPLMLRNDGEILHEFLDKTEADFVTMICTDVLFNINQMDERSDLALLSNMLEKINLHKNRDSVGKSATKNIMSVESYEIHVAYAVDIIFKCQPLVDYLRTIRMSKVDDLINNFIDAMIKLRTITDQRLKLTAYEEIKRDNDLKTAYRSSMLLSENIQELEDQLDKQRQELGKENDRKQEMLDSLSQKIKALKIKMKEEIDKIIENSEVKMMKDYNKSIEVQAELSELAKESTQQYETLLEDHLNQEKVLRAKRLKVEAQLASWVAKYDTDIGEKQAEYEELEATFQKEKDEYELLEEKFLEQEREYLALMAEKEAEEQRIQEEKAWIFLQNRAARRIQRCWKAYKARKLARKKGRKGKKKGEEKKKSPKDKKAGETTTLKGGPDPNAVLSAAFDSELLADIQQKDAFEKKDVVVDL